MELLQNFINNISIILNTFTINPVLIILLKTMIIITSIFIAFLLYWRALASIILFILGVKDKQLREWALYGPILMIAIIMFIYIIYYAINHLL